MKSWSGHPSRAIGLSAELSAAKSLTSELIAGWPADQMLRAGVVLEQYPELQNCKSALVELAYEEFCQRQEAGEKIDPESFAGGFPAVRSSLLDLIQVHDFLDDDSRLPGKHIEPRWPKPGDTFLGFELLEELGRGAFSRVFFAAEVSLGNRLVVVKVTTMGRHEAHTLGQLQHPHVVPIYSVRSDDTVGLTAVCMPYCGRTTMFDVVDAAFARGKPPQDARVIVDAARKENRGSAPVQIDGTPSGWRRSWNYVEGILHLGAQVAEALAFTHGKGFLHCDIKPSNVLVTEAGQALLFDFNLSFLGHGGGPTTGGTIPYMAPEQLQQIAAGDRGQPNRIDARTDVFGLAVTLFEMLTGRLPFGSVPTHLTRSQTAAHFLEKQRQGPASLHDLNPQVDRRVAGIIETCLAFRPEDRLQCASDLAEALWAELGLRKHVFRWLSEHRRLAAAVAVAASLTTGGAVYGIATREPYPLRELHAGWTAHQQGDLSAALIHLDRAVAADKNLHEARFLRGLTRLDRKDWESALSDFKALENQFDDPRVAACIGHLEAMHLNEYGLAVLYYKRAMDRGFRSAALLNNLGYCHDRLRDLDNAERCLEQAVAADPRMQIAAHNLARVRFHRTSEQKLPPDTAIIERALALGPETLELTLDAAMVFASAARFETTEMAKQRQIERCLDFCARSVRLGATRNQLQVGGSLCKSIQDSVRFQDLMQQAGDRKSSETSSARYMVNPVRL